MIDFSLSQALAPGKRTQIVSSDGVTISTQEYGNPGGRPLLFLHFFGGSHLMWLPQLTGPLAGRFRLVTLDHRGHGESGKPGGAEPYHDGERFADDIHAVITGLGLVKPILVGWSMSGVLAADYLAKYGDSGIGGVVLNAANNNIGNERAFEEQFGPAFANFEGIYSPDLYVQLVTWNRLNRYLAPESASLPPGVNLATNVSSFLMSEGAKRHIVMRQRGVLDHLPTYRDLKAPLLMIHGKDDQIVLPRAAEQILELNPRAEMRWYDEVGHAPNWFSTERFNADLAEFAGRLG